MDRPKNNNGLGAMPRPLRVICGYWTKAIALPRVPGIFTSFKFRAAFALWRYPLSRASGDGLRRMCGKIAVLLNASGTACEVKVPRSPAHASAPETWGLGRDALGLSHLTYQTTRTVFMHQLDQPPFPCKHNLR